MKQQQRKKKKKHPSLRKLKKKKKAFLEYPDEMIDDCQKTQTNKGWAGSSLWGRQNWEMSTLPDSAATVGLGGRHYGVRPSQSRMHLHDSET